MTVIASDTFTRADQSGWGTASDGETWVHAVGTSTLSIVSNEGVISTAATNDILFLGTGTQGDTEAVVRITDSSFSGDDPGIILRSNGTGTTYYNVSITASSIRLQKNGSGSLATSSFTATNNNAYWLRFRVTGNSTPLLQARVWADGSGEPGTWGISFTHSSSPITTAGRYGLWAVPNAGDTIKFDNFSVNDTSSGVTNNNMSSTDSLTITDALLETDDTTPGFVESNIASDIPGGTLIAWNIDALTISDIGGLQSWPADALSVSDSTTIFTQTAIPIEALTTSDTFLNTDTSLLADALTASDAFTGSGAGLFTEANTITDSLVSQENYIPTENNAISDSLLSQDSYLTTDALTSVDLQSVLQTWGIDALTVTDTTYYTDLLNATEILSVTDTPLVTDTYLPIDANTVTDSGGMTESSPGGVTNNNMASTDSLTITDTYLAMDTDLPVEALSITDALLSTDGINATEANTVSDLTSALQAWGIDSLSASDSFVAQESYLPIESNSIAESFITTDGYGVSDNLSASDTLNGVSGYVPIEAIATTDLFNGLTGYSVTDANTATDALVSGNTYNATDGLSGSDTASYSGVLATIEALTALDILLKMDGYSVTDGLSVADIFIYGTIITNNQMASIDQLSLIDLSACFSAFIIPSSTIKRTLTTTSGKRTLVTFSGKRTLTTN